MKQEFAGWAQVAANLKATARDQQRLEAAASQECRLNAGQRASLLGIAKRVPSNGVLVADEVGMGKTRVAVSVADAVTRAGGRVAILIPPGLGFQWSDELRGGGCPGVPLILNSLKRYLEPWSEDSTQKPWFDEPIVVMSHVFANWRLADTSAPWRWAVLPELYARARKAAENRWPRGYLNNSQLANREVREAGRSIHGAIPKASGHPARRRMRHLYEQTPWPDALEADEYTRTGSLRALLEQAVGLGLGSFDLIIIDEAHKSRGHESGLSRLLSNVVLPAAQARCLSVTATPVELDSGQWRQTLTRIQVDPPTVESIGRTIDAYQLAVGRVLSNWDQRNPEAMSAFGAAAAALQAALGPYLLRRDKREDAAVKLFASTTDESWERYRRDQEVAVELRDLSPPWRQALCAAESLAVAVKPSESSSPAGSRRAQLLRLTTGSGHGVAAWLDLLDDDADASSSTPEIAGDSRSTASGSPAAKRLARIDWWSEVVSGAFRGDDQREKHRASDDALYDHPAILAARDVIEQYTRAGEKVLVFGKFNRPMKALVELLNARELLRRVRANEPWPSARMGPRGAVEAANRQLPGAVDLDKLEATLAKRYDKEQRARTMRRAALRGPLSEVVEDESLLSPRERVLLRSFLDSWGADPTSALPVLRALEALSPPDPTDAQLAKAFVDLVRAVSDHDISRGQDDSDPVEQELTADEAEGGEAETWEEILQHIAAEFDGPEGGFARRMYGQTSQQSRRMMQLAFNRPHSHPRVLVAQSMVGREGLNLHEACRVVVLLHPEWNPAVVEQQVGRVDRLNSRWEGELDRWVADGIGEVPRIEIRPIIFMGTYDEMNWSVLRERQDDFRSQLSGIVIPSRRAVDNPELARELTEMAPSFSPLT